MSNASEQNDRGGDERDLHELHDPIVRELERPRDGYQPIPLTLIFLFFGLIGWGGWYLGAYSGDWRVDVFDPADRISSERSTSEKPKGDATPETLRSEGKRVYSKCASCHQQDGSGMSGSFPPLDASEWVTGPPELPVRIVLNGLKGPIEVAGESYSGQMPAWRNRLSDREIAAVLTYVRSAWSNDASAVEPSQVETIRQETSDRSNAWTASELETWTP